MHKTATLPRMNTDDSAPGSNNDCLGPKLLDHRSLQDLRLHAAPLLNNAARVRSADFLRALIVWKQQEQVERMPATLMRELVRLGAAFDRDADHVPSGVAQLKPGTTLTRSWQGRRHTVMVLRDGFAYGDEVYESLSEVARRITGTRWNGPRFFGLRAAARDKDRDRALGTRGSAGSTI